MYYFSYHATPIGHLRIECTDTWVTGVHFMDDKVMPVDSAENKLTRLTVQQLEEYFNGQRKTFDLPLLQKGTDFQAKVWAMLYEIPYGKIISYTQLTKQYGDLKAIRAVAAANGKNKLAIIVPCHRVIGSNNSLTGYAGGLWRKQWLLQHEAKHHAGVQTLF